MNTLILVVNVFNNSVTKAYDGRDASIEIVLMLLGAFILGYLLRYFIGHLSKKEIIIDKGTPSKEEKLAMNSDSIAKNISESTTAKLNIDKSDFNILKLEVERLNKIVSILQIQTEEVSILKSASLKAEKLIEPTVIKEPEIVIRELKDVAPVITNSEVAEPKPKIENSKITQPELEVPVLKVETPVVTENNESTTSTETSTEVDDLKVVEGIGPAIEKLLNENGIFTYEELASKTVLNLERILDEAGPRFRVHVPETWPYQSTLLKEKRFDEFNKLTEELKGGRKL